MLDRAALELGIDMLLLNPRHLPGELEAQK